MIFLAVLTYVYFNIIPLLLFFFNIWNGVYSLSDRQVWLKIIWCFCWPTKYSHITTTPYSAFHELLLLWRDWWARLPPWLTALGGYSWMISICYLRWPPQLITWVHWLCPPEAISSPTSCSWIGGFVFLPFLFLKALLNPWTILKGIRARTV